MVPANATGVETAGNLRLVEGTVHLWRLGPVLPPAGAAAGPDEQRRADRMRDGRRRSDFLCSRIWLRVILGRYLGIDGGSVRFAVTDRGKPSIIDGGDLCFSLSRSGGVGLVALTRGRSVGVDVESTRTEIDEVGLAERFFSPAEAALLGGLANPARRHAFYRLWVRKEAVVKASGAGLGDGLRHVDVRSDTVAGRWSVASVDLGSGLAAAVAVEGPMGPISTWTAAAF